MERKHHRRLKLVESKNHIVRNTLEDFRGREQELLDSHTPTKLSDTLLRSFRGTEEERRAQEEHIDSIDADALQFLVMTDYRGKGGVYWPAFEHMLEKKDGSMESVMHALETIVKEMGRDENFGWVGSIIENNSGGQDALRMDAVYDYAVAGGTDQEKAARAKEVEPYAERANMESFGFRAIKKIIALAERMPEQAEACEQLLVGMLDAYGKEVKRELRKKSGAVDVSLDTRTPEEHHDVNLGRGLSNANIYDFRIHQILDGLAEIGSQKSIDAALSFFEQHSAYYIPAIANTCAKLDSRYTVQALRKAKYATHEDPFIRKGANAIWHRLELGEVGVQDRVVDYLGVRFEIAGGETSFIQTAERITADGKLGLFDDSGHLVGYIELGDLTQEEARKATLLGISREMIFSDLENGKIDEQMAEMLLKDFLESYRSFFSEKLMVETGVRGNNASLREQFWFQRYVEDESLPEDKKKKAFALIKEYNEAGMKAFISLESDDAAGDDVFAIADSSLPEQRKRDIFNSYARLIEHLDYVERDILDFFRTPKAEVLPEQKKITGEIAKRARRILRDAAKAVQLGDDVSLEETLNSLRQVNIDLTVFATIFKSAFKGEPFVDFSSLQGVDFEMKDSGDLSEEEVDEMRSIFFENRVEISPDFAKLRVESEFDPVMAKGGSSMYVLRKDGELLGFIRYKDLENGNKYAGFLNAKTDMRGFAFGSALFSTSLVIEGAETPIEIKVRTENARAIALYERQMNFQIEGAPYVDAVSGKEYVRMVRWPEEGQVENTGLLAA